MTSRLFIDLGAAVLWAEGLEGGGRLKVPNETSGYGLPSQCDLIAGQRSRTTHFNPPGTTVHVPQPVTNI